MQIARQLAGFSMGEADVLRKAMGKKIAELLSEQKEKFIDGCVKNGVSKELGEEVFSFIEPFAGYGFNRSHAACYAMIGYQTAYLKAHWPAEFMAALLISDQGDIDRTAIEIEECRKMGIDVLPPDINQSFDYFTVVTSGTETNQTARDDEKVNTIRFGLKAIKNFGDHIAEAMINERKENGRFKDLSDFLKRIVDKDLNKKSLESLIKSGSFDQFGERGSLIANIENMLSFNKDIAKAKLSAQVSLFFDSPAEARMEVMKLKDSSPASRQDRLAWEKEFLGLYISEHPFTDFRKHLEKFIAPIREVKKLSRNESLYMAGIVSSVKKIITKSGESMAFVKIEDESDNIEALVFPRLYKEAPDLWQAGAAIAMSGKLSDKDGEIKILCDKALAIQADKIEGNIESIKKSLTVNNGNGRGRGFGSFSGYGAARGEQRANAPKPPAGKAKKVIITIRPDINSVALENLKKALLSSSGESKVYFKVKDGGNRPKIMETDYKINSQPVSLEKIGEILKAEMEVVDSI